MQHCRDERTRGASASRSRAGTKPPGPSYPAEHSRDDPGQPHWAAETAAESTHSWAQNRETRCLSVIGSLAFGGGGSLAGGFSARYTEGQILFGHLGSVGWWLLGGGRTCPGVVWLERCLFTHSHRPGWKAAPWGVNSICVKAALPYHAGGRCLSEEAVTSTAREAPPSLSRAVRATGCVIQPWCAALNASLWSKP